MQVRGPVRATRSGTEGACVELRRRAGSIEARDSKDPGDPVLHLTRAGSAAWLEGAHNAEFDHLVEL